MSVAALKDSNEAKRSPLPTHRDLYIGGQWVKPQGGYAETFNPATGESLGNAPNANAADIDAAAQAAHKAFLEWRNVKPTDRAALMRKVSAVIRANAEEFALIDSLNCGNPINALRRDITNAAAATRHNVPTTTVLGASDDWRFPTRVRLVPDADGLDEAPARA